jgi:hypothetical protein
MFSEFFKIVFIDPFSFLNDKNKRMRSPCSVCVCVSFQRLNQLTYFHIIRYKCYVYLVEALC